MVIVYHKCSSSIKITAADDGSNAKISLTVVRANAGFPYKLFHSLFRVISKGSILIQPRQLGQCIQKGFLLFSAGTT